jgi:hypothetical protein
MGTCYIYIMATVTTGTKFNWNDTYARITLIIF